MTHIDSISPRLSPEETAALAETTVEAMREVSMLAYMLADGTRTVTGFNRIWDRWASGSTGRPLSVDTALIPAMRDAYGLAALSEPTKSQFEKWKAGETNG